MTIYRETAAPKRSPWGRPDSVTQLAAGVWRVSTPGHGGFKLSPERNAAVPAIAREPDGWYEEDCAWAIAALAHPDAFPEVQTQARKTAMNWSPDAFTAITGEAVAPADSRALRKRAFGYESLTQFVVVSAFGSWSPFVPEGKVGVCASRASDGARQWALVDLDRYAARGEFGYVLDSGGDQFIEPPAAT